MFCPFHFGVVCYLLAVSWDGTQVGCLAFFFYHFMACYYGLVIC